MAAYDRIFNFSAGPSMLPVPALERAAKEMMNYGGSGMSVMEMSHRSKAFQQIFDDTQAKLRRLMNVPENYKILFLQTGASGQFSMVPLNLIGKWGRTLNRRGLIPVRCLQYITKLQAVSITSLGISPIGLSLTLYRRFTIINTQST